MCYLLLEPTGFSESRPVEPRRLKEISLRSVSLYIFILLVSLNTQPVFGESLTVDISEDTNRELINKLELRTIPNNASKYVLNRINIETLINKDLMAEGTSGIFSPNDLFAGGTVTMSLVDKQLLTLVFKELEPLNPGGVIHWLGHVQGDPDSFVRLTIDSESFSSQVSDEPVFAQMAGTIITKGKMIKLRPAGVEDYHILYEAKDKNDKYLLRLNNKSKKEKKARWIEAIGIQRDLLNEKPEKSFTIGNRGSMTGLFDFSQSDIGDLEVKNENDLERLVDVLAPYFPLIGSERFTFRDRSSTAEDDIYILTESINGIHISGYSLRIWVSKANNKVTRVYGPIIVDMGFTTDPLIPEDDAITIALDYMNERYENSNSQFEAFEAQLIYHTAQWGERDRIQLYWAIGIYRDDEPKFLLINTVSGNVVTLEYSSKLQPKTEI